MEHSCAPPRYCSCASPKSSKKDQGNIALSMLILSTIFMQHNPRNAVTMKTSWRLSWLRCICQSTDFESAACAHLSCHFTTVFPRNKARKILLNILQVAEKWTFALQSQQNPQFPVLNLIWDLIGQSVPCFGFGYVFCTCDVER